MADSSVQLQRAALAAEVSDDDDEVALMAAVAAAAADDDDDPAEEVDLVLSAAAGGGGGGKSEAQMNGVMVLTLLDKIIGVVDQIQQTQNGLEARQQDMEKSVSAIQGELAKLTKSHAGTAGTVNKMLDKVRKVSVNVKTVRANLEKQAGQIKKLESNENELLKRRNFKVLIYQDETKAPKAPKPAKASDKVLEGVPEEGCEELQAAEEAELVEGAAPPAGGLTSDDEVEIEEIVEESRAQRIKRSGKQRVDTIKKAFSKETMEKNKLKTKESMEKTRQRTRENLEKTRLKTRENLEKTKHSLEKKMGRLGSRMTPNLERKEKMKSSKEKVKKSLTPDHAVHARSKTTVYRVPPFTFYVKKVRDGEEEEEEVVAPPPGTEMVEVNEALEEEEEEEEEGLEEDGLGLRVEVAEGELVDVDGPALVDLLDAAEDSQLVLVERDLARKRSSE